MQLLYNNITIYNSCIEREDIMKKWIHSSTDLRKAENETLDSCYNAASRKFK